MQLTARNAGFARKAVLIGLCALTSIVLTRPALAQSSQTSIASAPDRFLSVGEQRLRFRDVGRGDVIVLLHGRGRTLENNWNWMGDSLALSHRVIALDQRGHGKSTKPDSLKDYGAAMVTDVVALLDHLGIERAHLVGFSMGALVAANVTVRFGGRVKSLSILAGPFYADSASAARATAQFVADVQSGVGYRGLLRSRGLSDSAVEASNARLMAASSPPALVAATQTMAILALPRERVSSQTVPALIAVGTADELIENNRQMAAWWPMARLLELPGVDHGGVERSPVVLSAIRDHLRATR